MASAIALSLASGIAAAVLCALGCRAIIVKAERWGLLDRPGGRKNHARPTPTAGGLAFWPAMIALPAAAAVAVSLWGDRFEAGQYRAMQQPTAEPSGAAAGLPGSAEHTTAFGEHAEHASAGVRPILLVAGMATALMVLGLWDDLRGLPWLLRLVVQFAAAWAVVSGGFSVRHVLLAASELPMLGLMLDAVGVVWIVGLTNSLNMLDNMDGLAGGVSLAIGAMLVGCGWAWSAGLPGPWTVFFVPAIVGTTASFLWFNKPPARLFMGDAGSYPLGFLLAICGMATLLLPVVAADAAEATRPALGAAGAVLGLLCLFAVPLYDTASVVVLRLRAGTSPFHPDHRHLSHRLAALGLSPGRVSAAVAVLAAATGLPAVLMPWAPAAGGVSAALVLVGVFVVLPLGETVAHRVKRLRRE